MDAVTRESVRFQREAMATVFQEIQPLLEAHWREIAHYQDIPLCPDFSRYQLSEQFGQLRIYTARNPQLIGYAIYQVCPALHYSTSLQARQDILFLLPAFRGRLGRQLVEFADRQLKTDGVQVVHQHVKEAHNFGPMLERLGYERVESTYSKRLDLWA